MNDEKQPTVASPIEPVVSGNYEFTDGDIRGVWAQIHKEDVKYMMTVFGIE